MFANISIPFESQCSNQHAYAYILVICVSSSPQSDLLQSTIVCSCYMTKIQWNWVCSLFILGFSRSCGTPQVVYTHIMICPSSTEHVLPVINPMVPTRFVQWFLYLFMSNPFVIYRCHVFHASFLWKKSNTLSICGRQVSWMIFQYSGGWSRSQKHRHKKPTNPGLDRWMTINQKNNT